MLNVEKLKHKVVRKSFEWKCCGYKTQCGPNVQEKGVIAKESLFLVSCWQNNPNNIFVLFFLLTKLNKTDQALFSDNISNNLIQFQVRLQQQARRSRRRVSLRTATENKTDRSLVGEPCILCLNLLNL